MLIRCIDFETTGVPTEEAPQAVCEVGWCDVVRIDEDFPFSHGLPRAMLVNPGRPMPPEACGVHNITDADLIGAPPITSGFMQLTAGEPDFYCAFNADFEQAFFGGHGAPWLDPYKAAVRLWPDAPNHQQCTLRYMLKLEVDRAAAAPPHRAGPDAYVLAALLAHILNEDLVDIATLVRWSKGPALLPKCTVGEHRGKPWSEVPASFLEWILRPDKNFDRNVKATVKHELRVRSENAMSSDTNHEIKNR